VVVWVGDQGVNGRTILKINLSKQDGNVGTALNWLRIGSVGRVL